MSQGTKSIYIWNFRLQWDYANYWKSLSEQPISPEQSYCSLETGSLASALIIIKMLMAREWEWPKMSTCLCSSSSPTYLIRSVFAGLLGYRSLFQIVPKLVNVFVFFGHFICKSRKRMVHMFNLPQWGWNRASSVSSGHPQQNRLFHHCHHRQLHTQHTSVFSKQKLSVLGAYLLRC